MSTIFKRFESGFQSPNLTQTTTANEGEAAIFPLPFTFDDNDQYQNVIVYSFTIPQGSPAGITVGSTSEQAPINKSGNLITISSQYPGQYGAIHNNWQALKTTLNGLYFYLDGGDLVPPSYTIDVSATDGINTNTGVLTILGGSLVTDAVNINQTNTITEDRFNWSFATDGKGTPQVADQLGSNTGKVYKVTFAPQSGDDRQYRLKTSQGGVNGVDNMYSSTVWFQGNETTINSRIANMILDMGPDWDTGFNITYTQEVISGTADAPYIQETGLLQFPTVTPDGADVMNTTEIVYNEDQAKVAFNLATIGDARGVQAGLAYTATLTLSNPAAGSFVGWTDTGGGVFTLTAPYATIQPMLTAVEYVPGADFNSNFTAAFTLTRPQASNSTWTGTVTLLTGTISATVDQIDANNGLTINSTPYSWRQNTDTQLVGVATITDTRAEKHPELGLTYRFTLKLDTPANNANGELITFGVKGGTSGWDATTATLLVQGSKAQVQDHIDTLEWWSRGPQTAFNITASLYRGPTSNATEKLLVSYPAGIKMSTGIAVPSPINVTSTHIYDEDFGTAFNDITKVTGAINYNQTNTIGEDRYGWRFGVDGYGWPQINDAEPGRIYRVTFSPVGVTDAAYRLKTSNGGSGSTAYDSSTVVFTGTQDQINANIQTMILNMGPDWRNQFTIDYLQEVTTGIAGDPATPFTQLSGDLVFTVTANIADTTPTSLTYVEDGSISTTIITVNDTRGDYTEYGVLYTATVSAGANGIGVLSTGGWTYQGGGIYTTSSSTKAELIPKLNITWNMTADYTSNFNFTVTLTRTQGANSTWTGTTTLINAKVIPVTLTGGNTPEFAIDTTHDFTVGTTTVLNMGSIVDTAAGKNYTLTLTPSDINAGDFLGWAKNGSNFTASGTKSTLNSLLASTSFLSTGAGTSNFTITYQQQQTTNSINQGSTIITMTPKIHSATITETQAGSCVYETGGSCISTSSYSASSLGGSGAKTYLWTLSNNPQGVSFTSSTTLQTCSITSLNDDDSATFDLTVTVTDSTGSTTQTNTFTHVKIGDPFVVNSPLAYSPGITTILNVATIMDTNPTYNYRIQLLLDKPSSQVYITNWTKLSESPHIYEKTGDVDTLNAALDSVGLYAYANFTENLTITYSQYRTTDSTDQGSEPIMVEHEETAQWEFIPVPGLNADQYGVTPGSIAYNSAGKWLFYCKGSSGSWGDTVRTMLSLDNAVTFNKASSLPGDITCLAGYSDTWVAGSVNGIYRSTDVSNTSTSTWVTVSTESAEYQSIATVDGLTWVAVAPNGLALRSTDGGSTWIALLSGLNSGSTTANFTSVAANGNTWVVVANNGYASRSTDNGATWTALPKGLNSGSTTVNFTSVAANGNTWVVVSGDGAASKSTNNGASWTALSNSTVCSYVCADKQSNWVKGGSGGDWHSADNGTTWSALPVGLNVTAPAWNGTVTEYIRMLASDTGIFVGVAANAYASKSVDGGSTWTPQRYALGAVDDDAIIDMAGDSNGNWMATSWKGGSSSTDNGTTWLPMTTFLNPVLFDTVGIGFNQNSFLATDKAGTWLCAGAGLSRSTDNGSTWVDLPNTPNNSDSWVGIAYAPTKWILGNGSVGTYLSTNNGTTLTEILPRGLNCGSTNANFNTIQTDENGTWILISSDGRPTRSTDDGASWVGLPRGLNSGGGTTSTTWCLATDGAGTWVAGATGNGSSSNPNRGYASRSTNNGATWTALPRGLNTGNGILLLIDVAYFDGAWYATSNDGFSSKSIDNGATWTALPQYLGDTATNNPVGRLAKGGQTMISYSTTGNATKRT